MQAQKLILTAATLGIALSALTAEHKKPISEWTCHDYLVVEDTFKPQAIAEAVAYSKSGKVEGADVAVEGTETIKPEALVAECEKDKKASFWEKVKAEWDKLTHQK